MGVDDTSFTSLTEGEFGWANFVTQETFTSTPNGWSASGIDYASNRFKDTMGSYSGYLQCVDVDTTHFATVTFTLNLGVWDIGNDIIVSVAFYDSSGNWDVRGSYSGGTSEDITISRPETEYQHSEFKVRVSYSRISDLGNGFSANNWIIDGYCENGAFRAVYSFSDLDYYYDVAELYVDFALISSVEDLDFLFEAGDPSPDNLIRDDEHSDFSVDISSYLTSSNCFLDIRDTDHTESDFDTWRINRIYIKLTNTAPYTDQTPTCSNMDDGDNLYGQYRNYMISTSFVDVDGFSNIDHVVLSCYDNSRSTRYWEVAYSEDAHTIVELADDANYIALDPGTSSVTKSGSNLDVTFSILINWAHPSISSIDLRCEVVDDDSASDDDYYEVNWEIVTLLDFIEYDLEDSSGSTLRGDINGDISAWGTVVYYLTSTHPLEDQVDVHISCANVATSPWEASNYDDSDGSFNVTVQADDEVGSQTYSFIVVDDGAGAGGTNLLVNSHTHSYISDRIIVTSMYANDNRVNIGNSVTIYCELEYEWNGNPVDTGIVTIEGVTADWESDGIWSITNTEGSVVNYTYNEVIHTGGSMGVTVIGQNSQSTSVVWDRIIVTGYSTNDSRVDISTQAFVNITLEYEYDSSPIIDGIVEVNGLTATHLENGIWQFTPVNDSITDFTYSNVVCSANEYGITTVNTNSQDITIIWDEIIVMGYTADDTRVDVDVTANMNVTLEYAYDGTPVIDGVVIINGVSATHLTDGIWHFSFTGHIVASATWGGVICSGNGQEITEVNNNGQSIEIIWDRTIVTSMYSGDSENRTSTDQACYVYCHLQYEYDDTDVDSGSVTINGLSASGGTGGIWEISVTESDVGAVTFDTITFSGGAFDITVVNQDSKEVTVIWDGVEIYNLGAPSWALIDESFDIWFNARLEYDNHLLGGGDTVVIDDEVATWNGTHFIITRSFGTSGERIFYVNSTTESSFDITKMTTTQSVSVYITNNPFVSTIGTSFASSDALYTGVLDMTPFWFQWDPVNDPVPPKFSFIIDGLNISSWNITSSWSASVVLSGSTSGEHEYQIESGLDYTLGNHTYFIHIENEGGYTGNYTVYVTVRDYTQPTVSQPDDFTYELGSIGNNITWTLSDVHPGLYDIVGNGTDDVLDFVWSWTSGDIVYDVDSLSPGTYNFTIVVQDDGLIDTIDTIFVTVEDTTAPEVTHPADITITVGATGIGVYWIGSDLAPDSYEILLNGDVVKSGNWNATSEMIEYSLDGFAIGGYTLLVRLFDESGNSVSDTVIVVVEDETTTLTDTTPTDTTTTDPNPPAGDPMVIVLVIVGASGAIIAIIIIIIIQKKKG